MARSNVSSVPSMVLTNDMSRLSSSKKPSAQIDTRPDRMTQILVGGRGGSSSKAHHGSLKNTVKDVDRLFPNKPKAP